MTYGELVERADSIGSALRQLGCGRESRVALQIADACDYVVAALGVLRAGGAFVPIDVRYPEARNAYMVRDSGVGFTVTDLPGQASGALPTVLLDAAGRPSPPPHQAGPAASPGPDDLAYVMYTSGSTGQAKGVGVTHRNLLNLVSADERIRIRAGDRVLHLAPTAFDASTFEIWCTLVHGGQLVCRPADGAGTGAITRLIREVAPDWLFLTTGLFHLVVEHDPDALCQVGTLLAGGDVLSPASVSAAAARIRTRMYAAYGPTETTVFASLHRVLPGQERDTVPIGTALAGKRLHVLDDRLEEVPDDEVGEIYLGGEGLARSYFGRPAATAERFIPDPYSVHPGARLYQTGDRGSRCPDGSVEFHGRLDRQVKVGGFRVELGEIEHVLADHPHVGTALAVVAHEGDRKRVVAYVTPAEDATPRSRDLRSWLAHRLPEHMRPNNYLVLDELPLDPNGKVDRSALPEAWQWRVNVVDQPYVGPANPVQRLLVDTFVDALSIDRVGIHDSFFELGGDSLRGLQVLERLRAEGLTLTARELFRNPTVAALAQLDGLQDWAVAHVQS